MTLRNHLHSALLHSPAEYAAAQARRSGPVGAPPAERPTTRRISVALTAVLGMGCPERDTGDSSNGSSDNVDDHRSTFGDDCSDDNASFNPDASEPCDDVEQHCDESTDEGTANTHHPDADGA